MNDHYGLPAGKVEIGESYSQAAVREAKEEAGVNIKKQDLKPVLTMHRLEGEDNYWVDLFFEPLKWDGEPYNAEPHMHSELAWLDLKDLPHNVIPSVRFALEQIKKGNVYCEYGFGE
jgi:ADP-ribose pyrophosphatase YjhB (NUDIX family)